MDYSSKVKNIEESKTIAVNSKAKNLIDAGEDVISFGVGEPDLPTPDFIKEAAVEAMAKNYTGYTNVAGLLELREAVVEDFAKNYSYKYNVDELMVSNGGKQILFNALTAISEAGDEIIIPKPYWVSYPEMVKLAGAKPVFIEPKLENKYKLQPAELEKSLTDKTKAIIINSPSNPDGHFYSKEELTALIDVIKDKDIFIISDEIYDKLLFDNKKFSSMIELFPELKEKILIVNGMSKTYSMTGWRVGFGFANKNLIENMKKIQSHSTSNVNTIAQYASAKALKHKKFVELIEKRKSLYQKRRDLALRLIEDITELRAIKPEGAFYIFIDISRLIAKKCGKKTISDSLSFSDLLLEEEKVAVVPGSAFGIENFIRISFALDEKRIKEGISRISNFVDKIK